MFPRPCPNCNYTMYVRNRDIFNLPEKELYLLLGDVGLISPSNMFLSCVPIGPLGYPSFVDPDFCIYRPPPYFGGPERDVGRRHEERQAGLKRESVYGPKRRGVWGSVLCPERVTTQLKTKKFLYRSRSYPTEGLRVLLSDGNHGLELDSCDWSRHLWYPSGYWPCPT